MKTHLSPIRGRLLAGLLLAGAATTASAQIDAPSGRVGTTPVTGALGRSYAGVQGGETVSLAQLERLPPPTEPLQVSRAKCLAGRPRIAIPSYGLSFVQGAEVSAFAGGAGSSMMGRRTKITTRLVGFGDDQARAMADEALAGFGSVYRQSLVYDVEVSRRRFAALTRAALQGYNAPLIAEIQRAREGR